MEYKKDLSKKILESLTCVVENNEIFLECKGRKGIVCTAFFNEKPPDPPGVDFKKKFVDVFFLIFILLIEFRLFRTLCLSKWSSRHISRQFR